MKESEQIQFLNETLLDEMPQYRREAKRVPRNAEEQRTFLRCLMNVREPGALSERFKKHYWKEVGQLWQILT